MALTTLGRDRKTTVAADTNRAAAVPARGWVREAGYAVVVAGFAVMYAVASLHKHHSILSTGYDLGIFEQIVRAYAEGRQPITELKGPGYNALGDHFHPIVALLAPAYRLHPHAETLLVAQAVLFAISILPVTRIAVARLGTVPGFCIGIAYGLSWGLQSAIDFDFHEIAFAVPLLAFSLEELLRQRWRAAAAWALPLLLVKEDLWVTVALIGAFIAFHRRRLGLTIVAVAIAAGVITLTVIIPAFNINGGYDYTAAAALDGTDPFTRWLTPATKWHTVLSLVAITGFIACRSPLLLLMAPTLAWRFWEPKPSYWGITFHYSAVLMPIAFIALTDGLDRILHKPRRQRRTARITSALRMRPRRARAIAAAGVLAIGLAWSYHAGFPLERAAPWHGPPPAYAADVSKALEHIPDGATVAAVNELAPQLTDRCRVSLWPPTSHLRPTVDGRFQPPPDWVVTVLDVHRWHNSLPIGAGFNEERTLRDNGYRLVTATAGIAIYRLDAGLSG